MKSTSSSMLAGMTRKSLAADSGVCISKMATKMGPGEIGRTGLAPTVKSIGGRVA